MTQLPQLDASELVTETTVTVTAPDSRTTVAKDKETYSLALTRDEIDALARWHSECEKRCAEMKEYTMAQTHYDRNHLFKGMQNTGWYLRTNSE